MRERVTPPEGDYIQGYRVPGGTYIGLNTWGVQRNEIFGDDPDAFRPERWMIDDDERVRVMHQTQELVFGHGATKCLGFPIAMMELHKMVFEVKH
jgi:cytochrome P450